MKYLLWFAATLLVTALTSLAAVSQQAPVLRTTTYGVRIDALVSDGSRPVVGLKTEDFEVLDKGVPQRLDAAEAADHVAVGFAIDTSFSERGSPMVTSDSYLLARGKEFFPSILQASETLLRTLTPVDRAAILAVADRIVPLVPLTQDPGALRQGLLRIQTMPPRAVPLFTDGHGTITFAHETDGLMPLSSVWDGAFAAASLVARDSGRPLVVVVSDGVDNASWLARTQIARTLGDLGIVVDFVQTPWRRTHPGIATPEDLPKKTGGVIYKTDDSKLAEEFKERLAYLRQSYVLTYEPRGVGTNDGWHDVVVKVKGRSVNVKARPGYYANRPAK